MTHGHFPLKTLSDRWFAPLTEDPEEIAAIARIAARLSGFSFAAASELMFVASIPSSRGPVFGVLVEIEFDAAGEPGSEAVALMRRIVNAVPGMNFQHVPAGSPATFDGRAAFQAFCREEDLDAGLIEAVAVLMQLDLSPPAERSGIRFLSRGDVAGPDSGNISIFDFDENGALLRVTVDHDTGRLFGLRKRGGQSENVPEAECAAKVGAFIAQSL